MDAGSSPLSNCGISLGSALVVDADELIMDGDSHHLLPPLRELLIQYRSLLDGAVAVVSGLSLAEVDMAFTSNALPVIACTGYEACIPPDAPHLDPHPPGLHSFTARLTAHAPELDRAEVKTIASGIEVRVFGPSRHIGPVSEYLRHIVHTVPDFQLYQRSNRFQIVPTALRKRRLISTLQRYPQFRDARIVFLGDNLPSGDAMRAVDAVGGVSMRVGEQFRSSDPAAPDWLTVIHWLKAQEPRLCALHAHSDGF